MALVTETQGTPEWHAAHVRRITSSNAAACLGLNPHCSAKKAWRIIMGREVERDNPYMQRGRALEAHAVSEYEIETGRLVQPTGFWVSDVYPWLGASPDGLVGSDGLLETKCPGKLPEAIPGHYLMQVVVQMIVTGRKWCDFWAWTEGGTYLERCAITMDRPDVRTIIDELRRWHETYVIGDKEPPRKVAKRKKAA